MINLSSRMCKYTKRKIFDVGKMLGRHRYSSLLDDVR